MSYVTAFGHVMPAINKPKAQKLHNKDPRVVANYVHAYKSFIKKHELVPLLGQLKKQICYPLSPEGIELYEKINELQCKGVQHHP
jgi:hypothetical protein